MAVAPPEVETIVGEYLSLAPGVLATDRNLEQIAEHIRQNCSCFCHVKTDVCNVQIGVAYEGYGRKRKRTEKFEVVITVDANHDQDRNVLKQVEVDNVMAALTVARDTVAKIRRQGLCPKCPNPRERRLCLDGMDYCGRCLLKTFINSPSQ